MITVCEMERVGNTSPTVTMEEQSITSGSITVKEEVIDDSFPIDYDNVAKDEMVHNEKLLKDIYKADTSWDENIVKEELIIADGKVIKREELMENADFVEDTLSDRPNGNEEATDTCEMAEPAGSEDTADSLLNSQDSDIGAVADKPAKRNLADSGGSIAGFKFFKASSTSASINTPEANGSSTSRTKNTTETNSSGAPEGTSNSASFTKTRSTTRDDVTSSSGSSNSIKETATNSRKRTRKPENWRQTKIKLAYNTGKEHISRTGKLISARVMGKGCSLNCKSRCRFRVSEAERKLFFEQFWALGDHSLQWEFINKYVKCIEPARPSVITSQAQRKVTRKYSIRSNEGHEVVCKTMFLSTLCISERMVTTAYDKLQGLTICLDKRGTNRKSDAERLRKLIAGIDDHISLFEVVPSHYCKKEVKRKYLLEPGLSIKIMYGMYETWMKNNRPEEEVANQRRYKDRFHKQYNFGFFYPKKDQCELCNIYSRCNPRLRERLQSEIDDHLRNKKLARKSKSADKKAAKNDSTLCYAVFDVQKVLLAPKDEASVRYYKRKLYTYNFSVFDGARKKGRCYVWHEGEGKRGASEVASCLEEFIRTHIELHRTKEFRFWSDDCFGQNKNTYIFSMFSVVSHRYGVKITIKYLETGHTQNECDSMHARIENSARGMALYTPDEWYAVMEKAKIRGEKYDVVKMKGKMLEMRSFCDTYQKWNGHEEIDWKTAREVIFDPKEAPGTVSVRHSLDETVQPKVINVLKNLRKKSVNLSKHKFESTQTNYIRIPHAKLMDLASLCSTNIIPLKYHTFYKSLVGPDRRDVTDDDHWVLEGTQEFLTDYAAWYIKETRKETEQNAQVESPQQDEQDEEKDCHEDYPSRYEDDTDSGGDEDYVP